MTIYSHVYIVTRRKGCEAEILNAHRRLEFARKDLATAEEDARKAGSRCKRTQAGCCLRVQKGDSVKITIMTTIDEEIDSAIYGDFYAFSRMDPAHPGETHPWVQQEKGGQWIPVNDWKAGRYTLTADRLRALARHFIEVGRRMGPDE